MSMLDPQGLPALRVEVRDQGLNRLGLVDDYATVDVVITFNAVGRWQMDVPTTCAQLANLIAPGSGILIIREDTGDVVFSGGTEDVTEVFDPEAQHWTIRGRDDNGFLADRLALPNTSESFGGTTFIGQVVTDSPLVYYRLGEVSGPGVFDSSGNVRTATANGTLTFGQPGAILDGDFALLFGGGYVSVPSFAYGSAISVEAWINTTSTGNHPIYSTRGAAGAGQFYFGISSGRAFSFCNDDVGGNVSQIGSATVNDGVWHHLVWTSTGTTTILYVDGAQDLTHAQTWTVSPTRAANIGFDTTSGELFAGTLDEVSVYGTVLNAGRVLAHYVARYAGFDVHTGTAEAVMRAFVDTNAGPSAIVARQVPNLVLGTYNTLGPTITEQARFANLLDLLRLLAVKGGTGSIPLGFSLKQSLGAPNAGKLVFSVFAPQDLTGRVVYSPSLQNLLSYTRIGPKAPSANYVYVAGRGALTGRPVISVSDTASVASWGRRELMKDRRDTADAAIMVQSGVQELVYHEGAESVTLNPLPTWGLLYGQDYGLGDQITFVTTLGAVIQEVVHEVEIHMAADGGVQIVPHIGPASALDPESATNAMQTIDQRLAALEAS